MKKYKLSPWHDGSVKPVHKGCYQTDACYYDVYQYWNGKYWCAWFVDEADMRKRKSVFQNVKWRGILK